MTSTAPAGTKKPKAWIWLVASRLALGAGSGNAPIAPLEPCAAACRQAQGDAFEAVAYECEPRNRTGCAVTSTATIIGGKLGKMKGTSMNSAASEGSFLTGQQQLN